MTDIERVGKYIIEEQIGQGGMGTVYKARDSLIKRTVAIKVMSDPNIDKRQTAIKRFYREAQAVGRLKHSNIITLYDAGEYEDMPYLVMEYLEGRDLWSLMKEDQLPDIPTILAYIEQVCDALEYAHQKGIIHRDIKPANIFILNSGEVKLMDFGVAKFAGAALTQTGALLGTIFYMSPEQIAGKDIDHRTDIFSLGVVLYELLSHRKPFEGETITAVLTKILFEDPLPFEPEERELPEVISHIVFKAMAKEKESRYQSASDLGLDLAKVRMVLKQQQMMSTKSESQQVEIPSKAKTERKSDHVLKEEATRKKEETPETKAVSSESSTEAVSRAPAHSLWSSPVFLMLLTTFVVFVSVFVLVQFDFIKFSLRNGNIAPPPSPPSTTDASSNTSSNQDVDIATSSQPTTTPSVIDTKPVIKKPTPSKTTKQQTQVSPTVSNVSSPKEQRIRYYLAQAEAAKLSGDWAIVEDYAHRVLELEPGESKARELIEQAQQSRDRIKLVQQVGALMREGLTAYDRKDYATTITLMNKILELDPANTQANSYLKKAQQEEREYRSREANRYFEQGKQAFQIGEWSNSIVAMQKVLNLVPEHKQAKDYLDKARANLKQKDHASGENITLLQLLGQQAFNKGDFEKCIELMDRILSQDRHNTFAQEMRKRAESSLGRRTAPGTIAKLVSDMKIVCRGSDLDQCARMIEKVLAEDPANQTAKEYKEQLAKRRKDTLQNGEVRQKRLDAIHSLVLHGELLKAMQEAEKLANDYPDNPEVKALYQEIKIGYEQSLVPTPTPLPNIEIQHEPPDELLHKEKYELSMSFSGYDRSTTVTLFYKRRKDSSWKQLKMIEKGQTYTATISPKYVRKPGLDYYFLIKDRNGKVIYDGMKHPYSVKVIKETGNSIPVF